MLFIFKMFEISRNFSGTEFYFNSVMIRKYTLYDLHSLKFTETCFMTQNIIFLWMLYVQLKRICILLLLGGVFCNCQLGQVGHWFCLSSLYLYLFSICITITKKRVLKFLTITVNLSSSPFSSISFCFS